MTVEWSPDGRAAAVRLLCLDVDGVLTDGTILIDDLGIEAKRFHVRDGTGIRLWIRSGHDIAIITGRAGMAVRHRARELGISHVVQGCDDKGEAVDRLCRELDIPAAQVAAVGDDLPDLPMFERVGYPIAVANAVPEVRSAAAWITTADGGDGAVREVVEHLLRAKDQWSSVGRDRIG